MASTLLSRTCWVRTLTDRCQYVMRVPDKSKTKKPLIAVWQCKHEVGHVGWHGCEVGSYLDRMAIKHAYQSGGVAVVHEMEE